MGSKNNIINLEELYFGGNGIKISLFNLYLTPFYFKRIAK
jgi:hypothetical protein